MNEKNIFLRIEYDGSAFCGWQRQTHSPSVQATLEDTLSKFLGKATPVHGAGRTDSGVHARGQGANFYVESPVEPIKWGPLLNTLLPPSIRIIKSQEVGKSFHARKMAISKVYEYRILNRLCGSALDKTVCFLPLEIDWERVRLALPYFIGEHDFSAFQGARATVKTTVRRVTRFDLIQESEDCYRFVVEGNGFLKQMVRSMVGTVIEVGLGKRSPESMKDVIASCDRKKAGRTLPSEGLCLAYVRYPESSLLSPQ